MSLPELLANSPTIGTREALTTLAAELKTGETEMKWTVAPPTPLHGPGQFRVIIGKEIVLCEAGSSTTVKILARAKEESVEANHANGAEVWCVPTAESLRLINGSRSWKTPVAYATTEVLAGDPEIKGETLLSKKEEKLKVDSAEP